MTQPHWSESMHPHAAADLAQHLERCDVLAEIEMQFWTVHALWRTGNLDEQTAKAWQYALHHIHDRIRTGRHFARDAIMERLCHG